MARALPHSPVGPSRSSARIIMPSRSLTAQFSHASQGQQQEPSEDLLTVLTVRGTVSAGLTSALALPRPPGPAPQAPGPQPVQGGGEQGSLGKASTLPCTDPLSATPTNSFPGCLHRAGSPQFPIITCRLQAPQCTPRPQKRNVRAAEVPPGLQHRTGLPPGVQSSLPDLTSWLPGPQPRPCTWTADSPSLSS